MTTYLGMAASSGLTLDGINHVRQSVRDILTTPIGSRVMRRDYGSLLPRLIDAPGNDATHLKIRASCVMALARWEPRIRVNRIDIAAAADGRAAIVLDAVLIADRSVIGFEVPVA